MKVRKLAAGSTIEVGDVVCHDTWMGKKWYKVVRTTEKFAIVAWNDMATGKFPRVVPSVGMRPCGKRVIWDTTQHSVWRPIKEEVK
jgi:hypothetical protein